MKNGMGFITNPSPNWQSTHQRYTQMQGKVANGKTRRRGFAKYDKAITLTAQDGSRQIVNTGVNRQSDTLHLTTIQNENTPNTVTTKESIKQLEGGGYKHCVSQTKGNRPFTPQKVMHDAVGSLLQKIGVVEGPNCVTHLPPGFE